jgi:hypothetical protein
VITAPPEIAPSPDESPAHIETPSEPTTSTIPGTGTTRRKKRPKNAPDGTGTQTAKQPGKKRVEKPPTVAGYSWRDDGAGWQLRRSVMVEGKRKRPYVAHLSRSAFAEMKRRHRGAALDTAIAEWIAEKDAA